MSQQQTFSQWEKLGLPRPSATDYEEHSAVGDVATGRRFKAVQEVPNIELIDTTTTTSTIYYGESKPGTATSAALWRIKRYQTATAPIAGLMADGNDNFDNIWNNRASLSYS